MDVSVDALKLDRPMPHEAPLAMPVQDFQAPPPAGLRRRIEARTIAARMTAFGGAAIAAAIGGWQMLAAFGPGIGPLQIALMMLFTVTFFWVSLSFTAVVAGGFFRPIQTPEPPSKAVRLAILMPIYHEDSAASLGALVALAEELVAARRGTGVEIFVLSDSREPGAVAAERMAVCRARALSPLPIYYRRRTVNTDHKSGNVADFVRLWGGAFSQMLVLDADSVMAGETVSALSDRMAADPELGLIQTMPVLVGGETIFARLQQFAGRVYGPMVARGVAAWSGDSGNFWGHNAIIRVSAFAACCGLPRLSGRPPFGGSILSHDFVEAALLRRAGWKVRLDADLKGSFEGSPPTLIDVAKRERRWAQGNLQHLRLLGMRGMSMTSRTHFVIGVMGFVMSPIWLAMIVTGMMLSGWVLLSTPEYFPATYQLFPDWPVFDTRLLLWLFGAAMAFLLLPKLLATIRAARRPLARNVGGKHRVAASAIFEILLSALIAPVQMLVQTGQILEILAGRDSGWGAQLRRGSVPSWRVVWAQHWRHVAAGLATLGVLAALSRQELIWLSPVLAGLILAPVTTRYSASPLLGRWARRAGLLVTPEERAPPPILRRSSALARRLATPRDPARVLADLADNANDLAAYEALLPEASGPVSTRLPQISAAAKISHAPSRSEALSYLDPNETLSLVESSPLIRQWAALPQ